MSRLIDALGNAGETWSPISALELEWAISKCDGQKADDAIHLLQAYLLIATWRNAETCEAMVADSIIAEALPKFKKRNEKPQRRIQLSTRYTRSGFNRGFKGKLRDCGLLSFDTPEPAEGTQGNETTRYRFPFIEEIERPGGAERMRKALREASRAECDQQNRFSHAGAKGASQKITCASEESPGNFTGGVKNPSRAFTETEEEGLKLEEGSCSEGAVNCEGFPSTEWRPVSNQQCPRCYSTDIRERDDEFRCFKCERRGKKEGWYPF